MQILPSSQISTTVQTGKPTLASGKLLRQSANPDLFLRFGGAGASGAGPVDRSDLFQLIGTLTNLNTDEAYEDAEKRFITHLKAPNPREMYFSIYVLADGFLNRNLRPSPLIMLKGGRKGFYRPSESLLNAMEHCVGIKSSRQAGDSVAELRRRLSLIQDYADRLRSTS